MAQKVRNFVCTWHKSQYDKVRSEDMRDEDFVETWVRTRLEDTKIIKYAAWQLERGEERDGLHVQMYLETTSATTFARIQKLFEGVWTQARVATRDQARAYAMKEDTRVAGPWEHGEWSVQGERTDLVGLADMVRNGMRMSEVAHAAPAAFARYARGLQALRAHTMTARNIDTPPEVHVRWGAPGSGKTRYVYEAHAIEDIWTHGGGRWFDGYDGHKVALFDDFYGGIPLSLLLRITDRYPMRVEVKGGYVEWNPEVIYFTSNTHPENWYRNIPDKRALLRRFTTITKIGDENYQAQGDGHDDAHAYM